MIQILSPRSVTRGHELKGLVEIKPGLLEGARAIEIIFYNLISFGKEKENHSSWAMKKRVGAKEAIGKKEIPFEFMVEPYAPITYSGKLLTSKWKLKIKVDFENAFDKEEEQEIAVFR